MRKVLRAGGRAGCGRHPVRFVYHARWARQRDAFLIVLPRLQGRDCATLPAPCASREKSEALAASTLNASYSIGL